MTDTATLRRLAEAASADVCPTTAEDDDARYLAAVHPAAVLALLDEVERLRKVPQVSMLDALAIAMERAEAAEKERDRLRVELESVRADALRYRYLRNRSAQAVLTGTGKAAGCWIDCDFGTTLTLLTGDDADAAIDAAMGANP